MADVDLELRLAWTRHIGDPEASGWCDIVLGHYRAEGRHYHGLRHVAWVVRHAIEIGGRQGAGDVAAIVAAAFFHDVVYEPTRSDNERVSAGLAERALAELGWADARRRHVAEMVLATVDHDVDALDDASPSTTDTAVLLAADLAVLATEPGPYADYARAVRKEYAHVDDEGWRLGRAAVLRSLLGRGRLYAERLGLDDWERRARANMAAELAAL